jgi:trehalose 6-phosphate phosphatase
MKHLFEHRREIEAALDGSRLLLMLDFDGTIAPIAPTPAEARLPAETRRELERLSGIAACTVAVVSGRALGDVRDKVGIEGITYVGNHGLEVARPNEEPRLLAAPQSDVVMKRMKENLAAALAAFEGVIIEDKGYSLAVHYRQVSAGDRPRVKAAVRETVAAYGGEGDLQLGTGSMVLELRPPLGCDKGTIVTRLLDAESDRSGGPGLFAMYLGDDVTDEDAFKALRGRGWPVLVGRPRISYAEYYLHDPREVRELLAMLAERFAEAG